MAVLLTDVVMPGGSEPELAERLGQERRSLKVIYMSGYTEDAITQHGVLRSGVAFVAKPFTAGMLGRRCAKYSTTDHSRGGLVECSLARRHQRGYHAPQPVTGARAAWRVALDHRGILCGEFDPDVAGRRRLGHWQAVDHQLLDQNEHDALCSLDRHGLGIAERDGTR
jgi:CheY-like chemotaxis protein